MEGLELTTGRCIERGRTAGGDVGALLLGSSWKGAGCDSQKNERGANHAVMVLRAALLGARVRYASRSATIGSTSVARRAGR